MVLSFGIGGPMLPAAGGNGFAGGLLKLQTALGYNQIKPFHALLLEMPSQAKAIRKQILEHGVKLLIGGPCGHLRCYLIGISGQRNARDLKHAEVSDGKRRLTFNVAAGIWGDGEQAIASIERTYAIEKTEEEMRMATTSGFALEVEVPIVKSGGYQLRAAVQESSGALGSARAFIEVPDFNQPHVSLSSIAIADPDVNRGALLDQAGVFGGGTAVMRVFAPGAVLDYDFQVFGARNAAVEFRLFRGAERIFAGNRQPSAQHATGQMKLPDFLPPGDYALQVLAFDGMGKTSQAPAIQWVDFTLVRKP